MTVSKLRLADRSALTDRIDKSLNLSSSILLRREVLIKFILLNDLSQLLKWLEYLKQLPANDITQKKQLDMAAELLVIQQNYRVQ